MLNNYYIQRNLKALNYYNGNLDEIWGPIERESLKRFQRDFNLKYVDGIYGPESDKILQQVIKEMQVILGAKPDGMWGKETENKYQNFNNIKNFKKSEFNCKCCGQGRIDIRLVKILDDIRNYYGKPLIITSGCRCTKHNNEISGSSKNSWHLISRGAKASDFYVQGVNVTELLSHCIDLRNQGKIRYTYTNNTTMNGAVHIDIGGIK